MIAEYKSLTKTLSPISETEKVLVRGHREVTWGDQISKSKQGEEFKLAGWNKGLTKETNKAVAKIANNIERNEKIRLANIGREITWADKISVTKREQCKDPEFVRQMMARFSNVKTKPEQEIEDILNAYYPNQWKYGGDGSFVIGGKVPDFINTNGKKQIIEVFGRHWHKPEDEQVRKNYFGKFGFSVLVIWDNEIWETQKILDKIDNLPSVETLHELSSNKG